MVYLQIYIRMLSRQEWLLQVIADKLTEYKAGNIVVDPVMVATSGARLISEDAISILKSRLLPLATVITRTFHDRM
jgi:hydroxymethylpyrimidine/phosphomethylpyrimidine kinase